MSLLVYIIVIAVAVIWAIAATFFALARSRRLRQADLVQIEAQATIDRYRAALSQLNAKAKATAEELAALQRVHLELQRTVEAREQAHTLAQEQAEEQARRAEQEWPAPTIAIERLDLAVEIGVLLEHVARVARALRPYSAHGRGHLGPEPARARYDLHWLSDCLHGLDQLGQALERGSLGALNIACADLLSMYETYLKDTSGYNSRDTFQRLAKQVPMTQAIDAIRSIATKARYATLQRRSDDTLIEIERELQGTR
jgi:multidrug efflux pump subunit AcrA (membrane-fusion protein)